MSTSRDTRDPDLRFGGFSLWVFRRERPDSEDYWGGNWLYVKAEMSASGARVNFSARICTHQSWPDSLRNYGCLTRISLDRQA